MEVPVHGGDLEHPFGGLDPPLGGLKPIVFSEPNRLACGQMPAFTIGGAQFDRRDEFEVAREVPLGQYPWDPTIHATRHSARFALLAQDTVERLF